MPEPGKPWSAVQWQKIIQRVKSPLGFFVLVLLILFAFIDIAVIGANLPTLHRVIFVWAGLGIVLIVIAIVTVLIITVPQNLVFSDESHLRYTELTIYGTEGHRRTAQQIELTR